MRSKLFWFIILVVLVATAFGLIEFLGAHKPITQPIQQVTKTSPQYEVIGQSIEGRKIEAYTYGKADTSKRLLFVGGMHGGYEWNSVLLAYQMMDYLQANPSAVPATELITIIPDLNPDGVYKVTGQEGKFAFSDLPVSAMTADMVNGTGRFNTHGVDLNRNFDCNWKPTSMWRTKQVSAGTNAFSEPESAALRDFVLKTKPVSAVFWHSQANAVYASECHAGVLPKTLDIMNAYANAAGYPAVKTFDAYSVTGDSEGWLASIGIPAITVEMKTHETVEWDKNLAGFRAVLAYFSGAQANPSGTNSATAHLGQTISVGSSVASAIKLTPQKVVEDSRCPAGVYCIQAGTVKVQVGLSGAKVGASTSTSTVFTLSQPQTFGSSTITLVKVDPLKTQTRIADADYVFIFEAK